MAFKQRGEKVRVRGEPTPSLAHGAAIAFKAHFVFGAFSLYRPNASQIG